MSKQQQPKEIFSINVGKKYSHSDDEYNLLKQVCDGQEIEIKRLHGVIRSRPHSTPQAPDDRYASPLACIADAQKEHDAAIERNAREKVLKEAIEKIWGFQRDHIGMNPLVYRGLDYAREEIKSLRQQESGQEQPR